MKLIRGRTLAAILHARWSRPTQSTADLDLTTPDAPGLLHVFEQICQAVGFAHSQGIVHRDLKPQNVMVGAFGEVQVMDWGLSKEIGGAEVGTRNEGGRFDLPPSPSHASCRTPHSGATVVGRAKGTPSYMAPEQARGEWGRVDARADVFALGGILCAMLTGKPPHTADKLQDVIAKAEVGDVGEAHDRLEACGADAELVRLAKWCLEPQPADRPPDAVAVAGLVEVYRLGQDDRVRELEAERAAAAAQAGAEARRAELAAAARKATVVQAVEAACRADTERTRERVRRYVTAAIALTVGVILGLATSRIWNPEPPADPAGQPVHSPGAPGSCSASPSP
jgi:serine/threonine protein kinase